MSAPGDQPQQQESTDSPFVPTADASHSHLVSSSRTVRVKRVVVSLLLGQVLSLLISGTAVTSGILHQQKVSIPTAQSFLNYFLLALTFGSYSLYLLGRSRSLLALLKENWWKYLLAALVDVEANYFIVKAYQLTSVTSVQVLDCLAIPSVVLVSYWLLKTRFALTHYIGIVISLVGVAGMLLADWLTSRYVDSQSNPSQPLIGDLLVILGACLYGVSNVWQEFLVRRYEKVLFIGFLGIFGAFINGIQLIVLERKEVASLTLSPPVVLCLLGFALCMFLLYSLMPVAMTAGSAILVNLSLLSSDLYALFLGLYLFHYSFHPVYLVAYAAVLVGVVTYCLKSPGTRGGFVLEKRSFTKPLPPLLPAPQEAVEASNNAVNPIFRSPFPPHRHRLSSIDEGISSFDNSLS